MKIIYTYNVLFYTTVTSSLRKNLFRKKETSSMSFKSHVFTIEPYHLNFENVNAVNAVPSISVGSTKNSFPDYPIT